MENEWARAARVQFSGRRLTADLFGLGLGLGLRLGVGLG